MDLKEVKPVLMEEIKKYATHYFEFYFTKLKKGGISFKEHYDTDCEFDYQYFEYVVFSNDYFKKLFNTNEGKLINSEIPMDEAFKMNEEYKDTIVKEVRDLFFRWYGEEYITFFASMIKEEEEELKFAIEDEQYMVTGAYLNDEWDVPIDEKEKKETIEEAKGKQEVAIQKINEYQNAIEDINITI